MPDFYNAVTDLGPAVAEQLGNAMELPATEPQQQAMLAACPDDLVLVEALKAEARRRAQAGSFFGYIAYASLIASRPR